jgi:hypothetical protein
MKKLVATLIATSMLVGLGTVSAQASHDLEIRIPEALMIRITSGTGIDAVTTGLVEFDFVTNPTAYFAALESDGVTSLVPTQVEDFGAVIVFANRGTWRVSVSASTLGFVSDVVAGETAAGIALTDIRVAPASLPEANVLFRAAGWNVNQGEIANGARTQGWRSLGFGGADYLLDVDGDEAPGTYTTTVTYTIAAP